MDDFIFVLSCILEEKIKDSLEKEVEVLREILSNCTEEERCLKTGDEQTRASLLVSRSSLFHRVQEIRNSRGNIEDRIQDGSCNILFLINNLLTLLDKIREHTLRNEGLVKSLQYSVAIPCTVAYPGTIVSEGKRKNGLLTLP